MDKVLVWFLESIHVCYSLWKRVEIGANGMNSFSLSSRSKGVRVEKEGEGGVAVAVVVLVCDISS